MKTEKNIEYGDGAGRSLFLDIYKPENPDLTRTAVILLHGGGWRVGDKSMMEIYAPELTSHGFVVLAPEYRLLGESPWPAQLEDVKTAIRWVRVHADSLGIDPEKIVLEGFSAGAHLALMAGGTADREEYIGSGDGVVSDKIAAIAAFFPPVEFSAKGASEGVYDASILLGESYTEEDVVKAGPIKWISKDFPPTFLLHGIADRTVSYKTSRKIFDALVDYGGAAELHLYPNHIHEFAGLPSMLGPTQAEIALFFQRTVVDSEKYMRENQELNPFAGNYIQRGILSPNLKP